MKILVVLPRIPFPLEKGDKLRAYYQIRELSKHHSIFIAALYNNNIHNDTLAELAPYCKEIHFIKQTGFRSLLNMMGAFFSGLPLQCGFFYSHKNHKIIDKILNSVKPDIIYCQLFRMAEYVRHYRIPKILDYQDAFSKGMLRRAEKAKFLTRWAMLMEARRIANYEMDIFDDFDKKTIITSVDREFIQHPMRKEIIVVPNGVDFQKFNKENTEKEFDLIFSGNMNYPPNVDAAIYLAKDIFPRLQKKYGGLKLMIAGANPSAKVRSLANSSITVTGWVPSMTDCYAKSRICIAPMRLGTGLQNKLLEAMAMKLPCVSSTLAAQAILPSDGAIIECSTTTQFVEAVGKLLTDKAYYQQVSDKGINFVRNNYDWTTATRPLLDTIELLKSDTDY